VLFFAFLVFFCYFLDSFPLPPPPERDLTVLLFGLFLLFFGLFFVGPSLEIFLPTPLNFQSLCLLSLLRYYMQQTMQNNVPCALV